MLRSVQPPSPADTAPYHKTCSLETPVAFVSRMSGITSNQLPIDLGSILCPNGLPLSEKSNDSMGHVTDQKTYRLYHGTTISITRPIAGPFG